MPAQTPNSMGRKTWAEKLQALLLSNCTLRYIVLVALARATCYQHFISKTSMANALRSKSGPRSLCRAPALSLSEPALCRGRQSLCRGPALCIRGPAPGHDLCVRPRRSLCRGPALSVSGPEALCVSGPGALCVEARRSVSRRSL